MSDYAAIAASLRACTDPQKRYAADVIDELSAYAVLLSGLLQEWLGTELDPEDEDYAPWMESFTERVRAALAKNPRKLRQEGR